VFLANYNKIYSGYAVILGGLLLFFSMGRLPNPAGAVITTWGQVNGLGTVVLPMVRVAIIAAGFSTIGTDGVRLTANGDELSAGDDVKIMVNPAMVTPTITALNPISGSVASVVVVTGNNFSDAIEVVFNGTAANFTVASDSEIHATVPSGATTGPISVTNMTGTGTSADDFIVLVSPAVLVGAGDIAGCGSEKDEETAKLLDNIPGTVITMGDNVYPDGTDMQFNDCYDPTWGRHKARTRPAPGNHDYHTPDASGYFNYFGPAAGEPGQGYYSYDLGGWHIVVLNTECGDVGGCGPDSPQGQWLQADLSTNPIVCTLAYSHKPRFSSGQHGNSSSMTDFWQILYDAGADVVLSGHDHDYERFAPQDPNGVLDLEQGMRQFVVGTGGKSLRVFDIIQPNSEVRSSDTYGVLKLSLEPTSYDWVFVPIAGQTVVDSGSGACHQGPNQAPNVGAGPDHTINFPDSTTLDGAVIDDGLPEPPGVVTTTWSLVSGPGHVIFADASAVETTASFSQVGRYVLRLTASDGGLTTSDEVSITVAGPGGVIVKEIQVSASSDDAEERATGNVSLTSNDLNLIRDSSDQTVGIRFNQVDIPQDAVILNTYVQFQVDETTSGATSLTIQGEDVDDAGQFVKSKNNVSSRPRTTAAVSWSPEPWSPVGQAGSDQQTPDIASLIQEIVNRSGWSSGNSLAIIITGSGERVAESYDGDPNGAPLLHVKYTIKAPNQAPTATVNAPANGASFSEGDPISFSGTATDTEDGNLTVSLSWVSDREGQIGTGGSFTSSVLSVGVHTITAMVTDTGGLTATTGITLSVKANTPPTVTVSAPADGASFSEGDPISFSGTAGDSEDNDLTAGLTWVSDREGQIGTGGTFTRSDLAVGLHTITVEVTASTGLTTINEFILTVVGSNIYLPIITK
jgi:hypothetical protein